MDSLGKNSDLNDKKFGGFVPNTILIIASSSVATSILFLLGLEQPLSLVIAWIMFIALALAAHQFSPTRISTNSKGVDKNQKSSRITINREIQKYYAHISDIIIYFDIYGNILQWAGNVEEHLGYSKETSIPTCVEELFLLSDREIAMKSIRFCSDEKESKIGSAEVHLMKKNGEPALFNITCASALFEDSLAIRMIFQHIDISLAVSEEKIDDLFKKFAVSIDKPATIVRNSTIEFANKELSSFIEGRMQTISSAQDLFSSMARPRIAEILETEFEGLALTDNPLKCGMLKETFKTILAERPLEVIVLPNIYNSVKKLIIIENPDKTQTKHHDACFELLFENTNDAIFVTKSDGRIFRCNPSAEKITGLKANELLGISVHNLFDPVYREISLRQLAWLKEGDSVHFETKMLRDDGDLRDVDISSRLVKGEEEIIIHVVRDITERNRFLSQLTQSEKLESLEIFAGGVALDFDSILEGVLGAGESALNKLDDPEETRAYLNTVLSYTEKALELTRHLKDYARQGTMRFDIVNVNDIATNAIDFCRQIVPEKIVIKSQLKENIGAIYGDSVQLKKAIINLILNSQEAMQDGGEILIKTQNFSADERFVHDHSGTAPGPNVELVVIDSGRGIDQAILPRIFDPFFTTKDRGEGTGLGLAVTYSIIESHGGYIDIESETNKGTKIRVLFPIIEMDTTEIDHFADIGVIAASERSVLIVDDEKIIQNVLSSILTQLGYYPIAVSSGKEALEFLASEEAKIDVILLDMVMPGLNGWQTYKQIKEYWPYIPVVVVTGYADERDTEEMLDSGLAGFIEKPFKAGQIARKLLEIFEAQLG
ncbi:PAS domain S-box protein [bacterium]|nr:PAS domain S-box protein [bacterium]